MNDTRPARQPADALDEAALEAKLSVPPLRAGAVSRVGLIERARASDCRVVGVTAPAGYGKSTLLGEWAHTDDRRVGWVALDRFDDDPAALLTLLASSFARMTAGTGDLVTDMSSAGGSALARAAPRLASAFRTSPEPFVLVVDDLHELQSGACHDVLDVVISGIPQASQMVVASRFEQPHLPRLRANGDAMEFVARDLALDAAGAQQIFSQANASLTPERAVAVTERTEGWPVGLYLAALITSDSTDDGTTISGDDPYVADYLYSELLLQLPEATQKFLRRTAGLERLCAPLCDAVVGGSGAREQLRSLEASSLFLIPLDRRREWYRYHALFREFLLGELRRVEPDAIPKLHLRAADWLEANGSPTMALEQLLHTTERDRCLKLVTTLLHPTYTAGQMSTVQRWLSTLGDSALTEYPPLAVLACWAAVLTGQAAEAQRLAAIVDEVSFDGVPSDGSASFESARAILRSGMCAAGPEHAMADACFAVEREPSWSSWRDAALYMLGQAQLLVGEADLAAVAFAEASVEAATFSNNSMFVLSKAELALIAMDHGRWADAADDVESALGAIEEFRTQDYATSVLALAAAARLAVHRGDLDGADRHLARAMRARPLCTVALPVLATRVRLHLAKVYVSTGDRTTARHLLREIDDILAHRPALGAVVDEVSELRRIISAATDAAAMTPSPLSPAELRVLPYLQTHLTTREIAARLYVSRNTIASQVKSIYRKLGVSSRSDAVHQATTIGLLGA